MSTAETKDHQSREYEFEELAKRNAFLEGCVERLVKDVDQLRRLLLSPSALPTTAEAKNQLALFGGQEPSKEATNESPSKPPSAKKSKKDTGRAPLPDNLERIVETQDPDPDELLCSCCENPQERTIIGWEITEIVEFIPGRFVVRELHRPKLACKSGLEGVYIAALPARINAKGRPGTSLLANLVVSKFVEHLPLYRIARMYQRAGIKFAESTLCDWIGVAADALSAIVVAMKQHIMSELSIQADETPAKARDPGKKGKLRQIYFFACGIPWQEVVFEYSKDRKAESLSRFLDDFSGEVIQTDDYGGYATFFRENPEVGRAGCWAHAVRKFKSALEAGDRADLSHRICSPIAWISKLETLMREKDRTAAQRVAVRQRVFVTQLTRIREHLDDALLDATIEPQSLFGKADRYAYKNWEALTVFLENGRVEFDNNGIEHAIRPTRPAMDYIKEDPPQEDPPRGNP